MLCSGLVVRLRFGSVHGASLIDLPWSVSGHGFVFAGGRRIQQAVLFPFLVSPGEV